MHPTAEFSVHLPFPKDACPSKGPPVTSAKVPVPCPSSLFSGLVCVVSRFSPHTPPPTPDALQTPSAFFSSLSPVASLPQGPSVIFFNSATVVACAVCRTAQVLSTLSLPCAHPCCCCRCYSLQLLLRASSLSVSPRSTKHQAQHSRGNKVHFKCYSPYVRAPTGYCVLPCALLGVRTYRVCRAPTPPRHPCAPATLQVSL